MTTKKAKVVVKDVVDVSKFVGIGKEMMKAGHTKAEASRELYSKMKDKHTRKDIIRAFQEGCGLTVAGSSTYFELCRKPKKK